MPPANITYEINGLFLDSVFRTWWFDPALSTLAFTACIHFYSVLEYKEELRKGNGNAMKPPLSAWPTLQLGPLQCACVAYWIGVYLWISVIPPAASKIPDGWPSDRSSSAFYLILLEVATGIVAYDAIFFILHWGFHTIPWLHPFHRTHHQHPTNVRARDVLHHSLVDGTLQVLVNIQVQRTTVWGSAKTRWARALHNVLVIWMLTESHTTCSSGRVWRRWLRGVREHAVHHGATTWTSTREHHRHHHHHRYQQFFAYLDDALELWSRSYGRTKKQVAGGEAEPSPNVVVTLHEAVKVISAN